MNDVNLIKKYIPENLQDEAIKKLNEGYPVQYIIGNVDFCGNIIYVDENVLIPRFETEYLVDKTIKYLEKIEIHNPEILEIGTGSGCISISLKKAIPCDISAIDVSSKAIEVAKKNAKINNVNISFINEDINKFITNKEFDLIISNPPYVPINAVVDSKTKYEPQNAIFATEEGLYFYKVIIEKFKNNLKDDYLIALEIGDKQGILVKEIVNINIPGAFVKIEKDYNDYERYVFISNKEI